VKVEQFSNLVLLTDKKDLEKIELLAFYFSENKGQNELAIQLKKTGTSRQGRKQYKITKAGIEKVKEMLGK